MVSKIIVAALVYFSIKFNTKLLEKHTIYEMSDVAICVFLFQVYLLLANINASAPVVPVISSVTLDSSV
jgi:hypothetical protein